MPEWLEPVLNTSALAAFASFVLWGIVRICKFLAPKVTAVTEGHVQMMSTICAQSVKVGVCLERLTEMHDATRSDLVQIKGKLDEMHAYGCANGPVRRSLEHLPDDPHRPAQNGRVEPQRPSEAAMKENQ